MELEEIVKDWLIKNGYDGLWNADECGCSVEDFMPCGEPSRYCEAGHRKTAPPGSGVDFLMYPGKANPADGVKPCQNPFVDECSETEQTCASDCMSRR